MKLMEQMILKDGKVLPGGILKVGSFLNQQIDTELLAAMGEEIKRLYAGDHVTKILTIESSGIAIAAAAGMAMQVPVVFAKKHKTSNVDGEVYSSVVHSFTHGTDYNVVVSRDYIRPDDRILLVDDFLASGSALEGLIELADAAGAEVVGVAIAIEKCFQGGGDELRAKGVRIESLAMIDAMDDDGGVSFRPQPEA
ncbi:MAG: xanthine phosphoribosyltransferase [Eubacterium sp.]|nr:xanthine phosphoribosyltransferase [Eubacterium sp.]MBR2559533.1 xanthine phosphoribosyltransferase [Bacillota bacterium]